MLAVELSFTIFLRFRFGNTDVSLYVNKTANNGAPCRYSVGL